MGFIRRFWTAVLSIATILGLYVGAFAINALWVFWILLATGVLAGGAKPTIRLVTTVLIRYRHYTTLLIEKAQVEQNLRTVNANLHEVKRELVSEYQRGIADGLARSTGAVLGRGMKSMPRLSALAYNDGEVVLTGTWDAEQPPPVMDAWLRLEVVGTGDLKGVVRVSSVDATSRVVLLTCCERTVPQYWKALAARAASDASPPNGVRLRPYQAGEELAPIGRPLQVKEKGR